MARARTSRRRRVDARFGPDPAWRRRQRQRALFAAAIAVPPELDIPAVKHLLRSAAKQSGCQLREIVFLDSPAQAPVGRFPEHKGFRRWFHAPPKRRGWGWVDRATVQWAHAVAQFGLSHHQVRVVQRWADAESLAFNRPALSRDPDRHPLDAPWDPATYGRRDDWVHGVSFRHLFRRRRASRRLATKRATSTSAEARARRRQARWRQREQIADALPCLALRPPCVPGSVDRPGSRLFYRLARAGVMCLWWSRRGTCHVLRWPTELHVTDLVLRAMAVRRRDDEPLRPALHRLDGPAVRWADGSCRWALCNQATTREEVARWLQLDVPAVLALPDPIKRRALIETVIGTERFLNEAGFEVLHVGERGRLVGRQLIHDPTEPIVCVEVLNSTPRPDGTSERHLLRVPPTMTDADEAVAWTFGLTKQQYQPLCET